MKRTIILCALIFVGCTYGEREEWDSGSEAQNVFQEQQQEEVSEGVDRRLPAVTDPQTETEPF